MAKKIMFNYLRKKPSQVAEKKKGSVAGAVALVIGTSIGSGILALPEKASHAVISLHFLYLTLRLKAFISWTLLL